MKPTDDPGFVKLLGAHDQIAFHDSCWSFERPLPQVFLALAPTLSGTFVDVGANTGFYSILMGRLRPDLAVHAFEPVPQIAAMCRENLAANGVRAEMHEVALSDTPGVASLYLPPDDHGLVETSASLNPDFKQAGAVLEVPVRRLDDVVAGPVSLIKVDVETFELQVLRGGLETLRRDRPLVVVELLPIGDAAGLNALCADLDYCVIALEPDSWPQVVAELRFLEKSWNQLLVPAERVDSVLAALDRAKSEIPLRAKVRALVRRTLQKASRSGDRGGNVEESPDSTGQDGG